ncbi:MAG: BrnT family toxin [Elusimicrobiota bacterium]
MSHDFDWDPWKAGENLSKHGISFAQAIQAFNDPNGLYFADVEHSDGETRETVIGATNDGLILYVVFTERRSNVFRIISAREATKTEKQNYHEK